ncbi:SRPBCC family protein [Actinokineospora sp.]|uniref:SRPBCC family protein n=1 Tax=Actinokineospora sp. TaxID=1872133 RepID=UPI004037A202
MSIDLRVDRLIDATPHEVFDAFVDPEAHPYWYSDPTVPGYIVESECDVRVGGTWVSAWGPNRDKLMREVCVFQAVDRPNRLLMTTSTEKTDGSVLETTVEVTFVEEDGKTRMTVLQSGFASTEIRDELAAGWPEILVLMESYLRDRK